MIASDEIRQTLAALRYHHRLRSQQVPDYSGSPLEADTVAGIEVLKEIHDRMICSDRADFLGGDL